jgi:biopolymer transport protein ExbD
MAELDTSSQGKQKKGHKKKRTKKVSTRVDLTPMVDLGFLLVTFFMLTTTFSKPQTMEINMPVKPDKQTEKQDQPAVAASKTIQIVIDGENKLYWYNGIPNNTDNMPQPTNYSKDGIRKILLEKNATIDSMVVLIKPMNDAIYKNVVDILDEMNICNIQRYALVDVDPLDLQLINELQKKD